ncbi:MAG: hypothetical protein ACRCWQ_09140 [Bacilli bacterium]
MKQMNVLWSLCVQEVFFMNELEWLQFIVPDVVKNYTLRRYCPTPRERQLFCTTPYSSIWNKGFSNNYLGYVGSINEYDPESKTKVYIHISTGKNRELQITSLENVISFITKDILITPFRTDIWITIKPLVESNQKLRATYSWYNECEIFPYEHHTSTVCFKHLAKSPFSLKAFFYIVRQIFATFFYIQPEFSVNQVLNDLSGADHQISIGEMAEKKEEISAILNKYFELSIEHP